jgi:hypothetical protein
MAWAPEIYIFPHSGVLDFAKRPFAERPAYFILADLLLGGHRSARDGCRNGRAGWWEQPVAGGASNWAFVHVSSEL